MNLPLRCLIVEDSEDDTQLLLHRLRTGGFEVTFERVDNAAALLAALDRQVWDFVISDYQMPGFTGVDALAMVRARDRDLPFILVSGQLGEELAVEAMRAGANDYLTKVQTLRLVPAVQRELREAAARRAHAQVAMALQASAAQLRFVTDHAPTMIAQCDQRRHYKFVNLPYAQMFGQLPENLIGRHPRELLGAAAYALADPHMARVLTGQRVEFRMQRALPSGGLSTLHVSYVPERNPLGEVVGFVAALIDISAGQQIEEELQVSNQNLQATLGASPDLFFEMGLDGRYFAYHSSRQELLAAPAETMLGKLVTEVLPEEAANSVLAALREAHEKQTSMGRQIQLTLPAGQRWFELSVARKSTPADAPPRFVMLSRDISARKQSERVDAFLVQAGVDPDAEPFFPALARFLAASLPFDYVCIARLEGDSPTARTLAVWRDGGFDGNIRYALAGTPCGEIQGHESCCFPANVCAIFPGDAALQALQAESYIGIPLLSHTGAPIGLIAGISRGPLLDRSQAEAVMTRVAPRAAAELERLSVETALRESEERFRLMIAQAPLGVALMDASSGDFLEVNQRFASIVGRSIAELTTLQWTSITDADNAAEGLRLLQQMGSGSLPGFEMEKRHLRPDGSSVWIHLTVAPVSLSENGKPRYLCMIEDVSVRRQAQEALVASEARARAIIDASPVPMALYDDQQRITFVNPAFTHAFGYTVADIPTLYDWWPIAYPDPALRKSVAASWNDELKRAKHSGAVFRPFEVRIRCRDGTQRSVQVSDVGLPAGQDGSHLATLVDITERERLEKQVLQSEKLASIGLLAAGVAHEINNPIGFINSNLGSLGRLFDDLLAVIKAYEDVQATTATAPEMWRAVEAVKARVELDYLRQDLPSLLSETDEGLRRVKWIVKGLKEFAYTSAVDAWQPDDLIHGLETTLNVVWNEIRYTCEVRREYAALPPVDCVLAQLNQVFMNLLLNAAQAIDGHGVITLRSGCAGDEVWVEVADTGRGISIDHQKQIFDPFFTTKDVGKGTGLGLSVSHGIVERHHGRIEVRSESGKGTAMRVCLPVRQPRAE